MFLMFHVGPAKLYKWYGKNYITHLKSNNIRWHCKNCISIYPFCSIDNTELAYIFTDLVDLNGFSNLEEFYTKCSVLNNIDFQQPSTKFTILNLIWILIQTTISIITMYMYIFYSRTNKLSTKFKLWINYFPK